MFLRFYLSNNINLIIYLFNLCNNTTEDNEYDNSEDDR